MEKMLFVALISISYLGILAALLIAFRKKRRISAGQILSSLALSFICIGLLCNSFALISRGVFLTLEVLGLLTDVAALIVIVRQDGSGRPFR